MTVSRTFLYNNDTSGKIVESMIDNSNPSLNPSKTSEIIKFTPMGHSPENVVASQVRSSNQERGEDSSPSIVRAH